MSISFCFCSIGGNGPRLYAGRVFINIFYFFGSARAYHCEAKPGTANRYRPTGVKAMLGGVVIFRNK
jgi:hypothetical protein